MLIQIASACSGRSSVTSQLYVDNAMKSLMGWPVVVSSLLRPDEIVMVPEARRILAGSYDHVWVVLMNGNAYINSLLRLNAVVRDTELRLFGHELEHPSTGRNHPA